MYALVISAPVSCQNWVSRFNGNSNGEEKCLEGWHYSDKRGILP
jgi:hypothetical protein